jgi:hypothetical protein
MPHGDDQIDASRPGERKSQGIYETASRGNLNSFSGMKDKVMIFDFYGEFAFQNVEELDRMDV